MSGSRQQRRNGARATATATATAFETAFTDLADRVSRWAPQMLALT